jgi:hypothetical protein
MLAGARTGWAGALDGDAVVSGVVRDSQGTVQMGALVQVLAPNSMTVATAFTDRHGHYAVSNLVPGRYVVRASAALFVPATRANLQLHSGAKAVVNLTLAALFDTASWLPASRRRADEPDDDWQWTLRSTANRPILRVVEEDGVLVVSSVPEGSHAPAVLRDAVRSGGGFGDGGLHDTFSLHQAFPNGLESTVRANVGVASVPGSNGNTAEISGQPVEIQTGLERQTGYGGGSRTVIGYSSHPELAEAGGAQGVQILELRSGQQVALGENVELEVGGEVDGVQSGSYAVAAHPFVRLTAHPGGSWRLQYRMATSRNTQEFSDIRTGQEEVPTAVADENGKLALEAGRHQEVSVSHAAGRGVVEVAYYHDAIERMAVNGGGEAGAVRAIAATQEGVVPANLELDTLSGTFRALATGYRSDGVRLSFTTPVTHSVWVAAEYATGDALAAEAAPMAGMSDALAGLTARNGESLAIAVKGDLKGAGTAVRASYRMESGALVTSIDPYGALSDEAYLSCFVRQRLHMGSLLPAGFDATIDVTNLLAQGYRPFLSADGHTLYFAQAPRTIQAGLSFTF